MSTENNFLPFKEYLSTLPRYSNSDQLQANQYKSILESELNQAFYQREFPTIGDAALGPLNANIPRYNDKYNIKVENENVNVYKEFWQYKQPGSTIFTDWNSAGVSAVKEDMSVRDLKLHGKIHDPALVLSNTNNIRNNLQNYSKEYLTTTNMLNSEAFANGVSYESGDTSPYRTGTRYEMEQIEHGNFSNKEDGDLYSRQIKQLRVDNPINYANNNISSWNYINPICLIPNKNMNVFHEQLKYGVFDLDSMKLIGEPCLTKNFNMIPLGYDNPVDVYNDRNNYPPIDNINYYKRGSDHYMKNGEMRDDGTVYHSSGSNLYCSANTNYVTMPKNNTPRLEGLDTSFQVYPGNNSVTLGTVMSPKLKNFIQNDLFKFNRLLVVMQIYSQEISNIARENPGTPMNYLDKSQLMQNIEKMYPYLFKSYDNQSWNINYNEYINLSESQKYKWIFNMQRNFESINQGNPELEVFINHLSIFKFGGDNINDPNEKGKVRLRELDDDDIEIDEPGCFLLLPTMLSEDLFSVREEIPKQFAGNIPEIHNNMNNCITSGANFETNATNCAFRGKASMWQQKPEAGLANPNFVPKMFNDPHNYNNDISNLVNPYAGINNYNAPVNF